jgi:hypothetical protein
MDIREDTTSSDGYAAEQLVQLLIVADGELDVARNDTSLLIVSRGVASEFEHLSGKVLHDSGHVDGSSRSYAVSIASLLEETVDTADRKLQSRLGRT